MHYYYNGELRLSTSSLGPNELALHLGCALSLFAGIAFPFFIRLWILARRFQVVLSVAIAVAVLVTSILLAFTYSRGGLLAAVTGIGALLIYWIKYAEGLLPHGRSIKTVFTRLLFLVCILTAMLVFSVYYSGLSSRLSIGFVLADDSVLNRVELWNEGLAMMAASPIDGWGWLNSGNAYCNWFQAIDDTNRYYSMVNTFIEVGVSLGVPALVGGVTLLLTMSVILISLDKKGPLILTADGCVLAVLICWSSCSFFSNFSHTRYVEVVPLIALIYTGIRLAISREMYFALKLFAFCAFVSFALSVCITIYAYSRQLTTVWISQGSWYKGERNGGSGTVVIIPDPKILGECAGKLIRSYVDHYAVGTCYVLKDHRSVDRALRELSLRTAEYTILFVGRQIDKIPDALLYTNVIAVHPIKASTKTRIPSVITKVYLPEIDEIGANTAWIAKLNPSDVSINFTKSSGLKIRSLTTVNPF